MYIIYNIEEWYCSSKELLEIVALPDVRRSKVMQTAYLQGMPDCEASEAILTGPLKTAPEDYLLIHSLCRILSSRLVFQFFKELRQLRQLRREKVVSFCSHLWHSVYDSRWFTAKPWSARGHFGGRGYSVLVGTWFQKVPGTNYMKYHNHMQ